MEDYDREVEWAMTHGVDVNQHLASLTTKRLDIPLGPMTTTEARAIAHEFAKVREQRAYKLLKEAEAHLQRCNDHWEECSTQVRMTAPEN